jgi:hypothetical protein
LQKIDEQLTEIAFQAPFLTEELGSDKGIYWNL